MDGYSHPAYDELVVVSQRHLLRLRLALAGLILTALAGVGGALLLALGGGGVPLGPLLVGTAAAQGVQPDLRFTLEHDLAALQSERSRLTELVDHLGAELQTMRRERDSLHTLLRDARDRDYFAAVSRGGGRSFATVSLLSPSRVGAEELDRILAGTALAGLGAAFVQAEQDTAAGGEAGINAVALLAIALHESSWGNSYLAREHHNLFGFRAYDGGDAREATRFADKAQGVLEVARYLRQHYLAPGGQYFSGYDLRSVGRQYASDPRWADGVAAAWQSMAARLYAGPGVG